MQLFSLDNRPPGLDSSPNYEKIATIRAVFVSEPFQVDTKEGVMDISPDTCEDWEDGYWVVYPDDGSKPYNIAPGYFRENYREARAPASTT